MPGSLAQQRALPRQPTPQNPPWRQRGRQPQRDGRFSDAGSYSGDEPRVVSFVGAQFSGSTVHFDRAVFDLGGGVESSGGVIFDSAVFSGGEVRFGGAEFSGGTVSFRGAQFSGGRVDFTTVKRRFDRPDDRPPIFSWDGKPPAGVELPELPFWSQLERG